MKNKIVRRLTLNFMAVIILFELLSGGLFLPLFTEHSAKVFRDDLEKQAVSIATAVSDYIIDSSLPAEEATSSEKIQFDEYLHIISQILTGNIWIVDRNSKTIVVDSGHIAYHELHAEALSLVDKVFEGQTVSSQEFSVFLSSPSITTGAPVYDSNGQVIAAVLLHSHIQELADASRSGIFIMLGCFGGAMVMALVLSLLLSKKFVQPLQKMELTTNRLAGGDYSAHTGVAQQDEIGSLAAHIDVLADKLDIASRESAALEQMRRDYIANVSHELRTPVMVLRGSIEALCDQVVTEPDRVAEYHQQMLRECMHLQRMVNDLLELSRLQNLNYSIEKTPVDVVEALKDAVRGVRKLGETKNVALISNIDLSSCIIMGDYGRLRQMFITILDNAIKFTLPGGRVNITADQQQERFVISITDTGSGISAEDLPRIFESFYVGSRDVHNDGTGLGLSIAKQIADRHGIEVLVESTPGVSSEFSFYIKETLSNR